MTVFHSSTSHTSVVHSVSENSGWEIWLYSVLVVASDEDRRDPGGKLDDLQTWMECCKRMSSLAGSVGPVWVIAGALTAPAFDSTLAPSDAYRSARIATTPGRRHSPSVVPRETAQLEPFPKAIALASRLPRSYVPFGSEEGQMATDTAVPGVLPVNEAACVIGVPLRQVDRIIDTGVPGSAALRREGTRLLHSGGQVSLKARPRNGQDLHARRASQAGGLPARSSGCGAGLRAGRLDRRAGDGGGTGEAIASTPQVGDHLRAGAGLMTDWRKCRRTAAYPPHC